MVAHHSFISGFQEREAQIWAYSYLNYLFHKLYIQGLPLQFLNYQEMRPPSNEIEDIL